MLPGTYIAVTNDYITCINWNLITRDSQHNSFPKFLFAAHFTPNIKLKAAITNCYSCIILIIAEFLVTYTLKQLYTIRV